MDKQIEELMKDMCTDYPCNRICDQYCGMYDYAERAINAGYRKIPENAVVLNGMETEQRLEDLMVAFDEMGFMPNTTHPFPEEYVEAWKQRLIFVFGQLRKETAEKFAEMASKAFIGLNCIDIDEWNWCQRKIDEICKEITEGKA